MGPHETNGMKHRPVEWRSVAEVRGFDTIDMLRDWFEVQIDFLRFVESVVGIAQQGFERRIVTRIRLS